MTFFSIEHGKIAYRADFALYGMAIVLLSAYLVSSVPPDLRLSIALHSLVGLGSWSAIEYAFHRFVLHGLPPFSRWHAEHHRRPRALICTPTLFSATLIATVFLPAVLLTDLWRAYGLVLGVTSGYFVYSVTHHAIHHWHARSAWLQQRKLWHALHHRHSGASGHYGVTSSFWDHILGSARAAPSKG